METGICILNINTNIDSQQVQQQTRSSLSLRLPTNCYTPSVDINLLLKQSLIHEIFSTRKNRDVAEQTLLQGRDQRDMIHGRFNLAPTELTGRHFVSFRIETVFSGVMSIFM